GAVEIDLGAVLQGPSIDVVGQDERGGVAHDLQHLAQCPASRCLNRHARRAMLPLLRLPRPDGRGLAVFARSAQLQPWCAPGGTLTFLVAGTNSPAWSVSDRKGEPGCVSARNGWQQRDVAGQSGEGI